MGNGRNIHAGAIANEFILIAAGKNNLTNMKLLKLCYIAHGFSLSLLKKPAFEDDVSAWKHGPVISSLYHEFKHFGSDNINKEFRSKDYVNGSFDDGLETLELKDKDLKKVIKLTWSLYKDMSGWELRELTHKKGTPWDITNKNNRDIIDNDLIKQYYDELIRKLKKKL